MTLATYEEYEFRCCQKCGIEYAAPKVFMDGCRKDPSIYFHCPNGHPWHFSESEADKLRRERDRLTQRLAEKDDEIIRQRGLREATEKRLSATKGVVTRIRNRVGNGVCPCCTRSFTNLRNHMATQHPEFTAEAAE